ncbi:DUF2254 domain-containing protein [Pararhodobacter sp. SW119]|uniref:DUF2254 domain-containing protein n=1 Tax=Pararhodobacter sp. SW119 TaxID=2780075 RepID=UPI001AE04296|nr:DUF2254 domain-containing protein [Pararhodobacter sp. SW119]
MFDSTLFFRLRQIFSQIWVKLTVFALLSVGTAFVAMALRPVVPTEWEAHLGVDAVETVLTIVASSMLAVSTFSLGIMADAIRGAADGATPRASALLLEDGTSQNVLATFLGAFIFSLVGIILLQIDFYQDGGRVVLLAVSVVVIFLIFVAFIRWINLLRTFGRLPDTLARMEQTVGDSLQRRLANPYLGCRRLEIPAREFQTMQAVESARIGHVQHVDVEELQELAEKHGIEIVINRMPGRFVCAGRPMAYLKGTDAKMDEEFTDKVLDCFTIGSTRTFSQDPQFGMIVMAETASRALSPAVNDPGTAIDVLRRAQRVLSKWETRANPETVHDRVWMAGLDANDFLRDLLRPIARDGAGFVEVQHILQSVLRDLARKAPDIFGQAARLASTEALARAEKALTLEAEREEIREIAAEVARLSEDRARKAI